MQHLGRNDDRFFTFDALADQQALGNGNLFGRNFDAQVAAGDHDSVGLVQDFVDVVDPFFVFDFGDDLDRTVAFFDQLLDGQHVLFFADERVGDEIYVHVDGPVDEPRVAFGDRWQVDGHAGDVYAFTTVDDSPVAHFADQFVAALFSDVQFQFPVVDQDYRAGWHVPGDVSVVQIDQFVVRRQVFRRAPEPDDVAGRNGNTRFESRSHARDPDLGPFRIDDDSDLFRHFPHVLDNRRGPFGRQVGRVDPRGVHAGFVQGSDKFRFAMFVRDGGYDLCLFVHE